MSVNVFLGTCRGWENHEVVVTVDPGRYSAIAAALGAAAAASVRSRITAQRLRP
jgi:thiamine monophosphate kinase